MKRIITLLLVVLFLASCQSQPETTKTEPTPVTHEETKEPVTTQTTESPIEQSPEVPSAQSEEPKVEETITVGNDNIGYFEIPKDSEILEESESAIEISLHDFTTTIEIAAKPVLLLSQKEQKISEATERDKLLTPNTGMWTRDNKYFFAVGMDDYPGVDAGILFMHSMKNINITAISLDERTLRKKVPPAIETILKTYREKKDDPVSEMTPVKGLPLLVYVPGVGAVTLPPGWAYDSGNALAYHKDDEDLIILLRYTPFTGTMTQYLDNLRPTIKADSSTIDSETDIKILDVDGKLLRGKRKDVFYSYITYMKIKNEFSYWMVMGKKKEDVDKWEKYILEHSFYIELPEKLKKDK